MNDGMTESEKADYQWEDNAEAEYAAAVAATLTDEEEHQIAYCAMASEQARQMFAAESGQSSTPADKWRDTDEQAGSTYLCMHCGTTTWTWRLPLQMFACNQCSGTNWYESGKPQKWSTVAATLTDEDEDQMAYCAMAREQYRQMFPAEEENARRQNETTDRSGVTPAEKVFGPSRRAAAESAQGSQPAAAHAAEDAQSSHPAAAQDAAMDAQGSRPAAAQAARKKTRRKAHEPTCTETWHKYVRAHGAIPSPKTFAAYGRAEAESFYEKEWATESDIDEWRETEDNAASTYLCMQCGTTRWTWRFPLQMFACNQCSGTSWYEKGKPQKWSTDEGTWMFMPKGSRQDHQGDPSHSSGFGFEEDGSESNQTSDPTPAGDAEREDEAMDHQVEEEIIPNNGNGGDDDDERPGGRQARGYC